MLFYADGHVAEVIAAGGWRAGEHAGVHLKVPIQIALERRGDGEVA